MWVQFRGEPPQPVSVVIEGAKCCGKKTEAFTMPWLAAEAWNEGRFVTAQGRLF